MQKSCYFYIDDVIWVFRDLTRQRPASIFDHHFLKVLKEAHDKYGMKVQMNVFYRTDFFYGNDEFTLADMTDAYKAEFEEASDWMKFTLHSKQEFPDYPFLNISYQDMKDIFCDVRREIYRFAGEKAFSHVAHPHWLPISKAGIQALYDCGVRLANASMGDRTQYGGDPSTLPYGHAGRLLQNRQPESMIFTRISLDTAVTTSLCGYNHVKGEAEDLISKHVASILDEETGMRFTHFDHGPTLNLSNIEDLEEEFSEVLGDEFVGYSTHEQYSYPDYYAYQPDHGAKILKAAEIVHRNGYTFIWREEE